jgi:hypothetical protein
MKQLLMIAGGEDATYKPSPPGHATMFHLVGCSFEELVEGVEVVVAGLLADDAGLLQQVVVDVAAHWITLFKKKHFWIAEQKSDDVIRGISVINIF